MYQNTKRHEFRQVFGEVFQKIKNHQPLTPLEAQLADIIEIHPEYHSLLENDKSLEQDYTPEMGQTNPFLHMALHLSIRDQIRLNRPAEIYALFQQATKRLNSSHRAEHAFMEALAEILHQSQKDNAPPNEEVYLAKIKLLIN